jgi:hypothetical protein
MNQDAKAFFKSTDPVFAMISDMKTLYRTSAAAATPKGFDILAQTGAVRYTSNQLTGSTAANGGTFVNDVVKCMDVGTVPATFDPALALGQGVFEVRGNASGAPAAIAYNGTSNGAKVEFSPRWGVEPRTTSGWPASTGSGAPRYLIYGYPTTGDFAGETPGAGFNAFEIGTLRADLPKSGLRVGVCTHLVITDVAQTHAVAANLLIHNDAVVPNESPGFCAGISAAAPRTTWLARVKAIFAPAIAFAQDPSDFSRDFIGGGPSGWSPMSWGQVAGTAMNLGFTKQPRNTDKSVAIPTFVVHAATAAGNALPGVNVTISVFNNSGEPAGAFVSGTVTVKTDSNGDATFSDVNVNKAGGYRINASGSFGGVATNTTTSVLFNVKNR